MTEWTGLPASPGCGAGKAFLLRTEAVQPEKTPQGPCEAEVERLHSARKCCQSKLEEMISQAENQKDAEGASILRAWHEIAGDKAFFQEAEELIHREKASAAWAVNHLRQEVLARFSSLEDAYLRQRGEDVEQVCRELIAHLEGRGGQSLKNLPQEGFILLADTLTPAQTMQMDKQHLRGIATEKGGATSHTAILAKSLGIPAVVGVEGLMEDAKDGETALLDGDEGRLVLSPNPRQLQRFSERLLFCRQREEMYRKAKEAPAATLDGQPMKVCVYAGGKDTRLDIESCDGVGLFRTEFLYLGREDAPGEEEQYQAYRRAAEEAGEKELTIRSLDAGGDKPLPFLCIPEEENPSLGWRAIRISLSKEDLFLTQLRAVLRASAHGSVRLMFPMIVTLEELLAAKETLEKAKEQLKKEGHAFNPEMPVGIMVETPAAVFLCDRLAAQADFFSIGTNDLAQYMTAADRMNERVQYLLDPCNLSVLRGVGMVCEAAQRHGIPVSICGESAADPMLIPLWLGLGVGELTVSPALVGRTKFALSRLDSREMQREAKHLLASFGAMEPVRRRLEEILRQAGL